MKATLKRIFIGFVLGAVVAFPLGMNFGRNAPLLSNPFASRDITDKVKTKADDIIENTREAIHDATRPVQSGIERR